MARFDLHNGKSFIWTPALDERLREGHKAGTSYAELARRIGCTYWTLDRRIRNLGLARNRSKGPRPVTLYVPISVEGAAVVDEYARTHRTMKRAAFRALVRRENHPTKEAHEKFLSYL